MSNLVEIKKRIESITSTIKVTKVMQMIATAQISKIKNKISLIDKYSNITNEILNLYLHNIQDKDSFEKYTLKDNNNKNILLIVFSSDKGTCGSINTNIFKESNILINQYKKDNFNVTVLPIGKKAIKYFNSNATKIGINVSNNNVADAENFNKTTINNLIENIINEYENKKYGEIRVIYHKFKNIITCNPINELLLPLNNIKLDDEPQEFTNIINCNNTATNMVKFILRTLFYNVYILNLASIVSSRMNAMDNATKNGQEIIDELRIKYNKGRQANITAELSDIVSGFEAIN